MVPIRTCGQPTERLFVAIANLKEGRGEKAKAKKISKRGVTGVGGITLLHSVSFSRIMYLILKGSLYSQLEVWQILPCKFSNLRSPGETWIPCLLSHSRCLCRQHCRRSRDREARTRDLVPPYLVDKHKNALTAAFSLACLVIRSRNEEAINSTRNVIYSLKVFYSLLYRRRHFLFVSKLI